MMHAYFQNMADGLEEAVRASPQEASGRKLFALEIARLGARFFSGQEKVAWCGVLVPFDLLRAMGVTSCFVEFVGAMLAVSGGVEPMLLESEQLGYSTDCCAYHRAVTGASRKGLMPVPDFLIATSAPCSGGIAVIENLTRYFDKDLYTIHVPPRRDREAVEYLADQIRGMVDFVADYTDRPLDPARLREVINNTNRAREVIAEMYRLAQAVPTPARRRDMINFGIVMTLFVGTPEAIKIAETYRDEFASKVAAGTSGISDEQVRLLWFQNRIQFKNPLEEMLEEECATAIVADELNDITWEPIDPDDPYTGFAERILSVSLTGTVDHRVKILQRLARDYQVDGAINPCHWGCRQGAGGRGLVEEGLKQIGVPVLNLEVDCIDPRNFSEGQLRTRILAFIEMLKDRKASV
jgi:benzoyl-CoA reductase/2-hydroxyglutaryl-CoA dehydratase subunit BcrC/BadD/HgdB